MIRCGIDLGTTFSAISYYDEDTRHVETIQLDHADGNLIIPSVVFFEPGGNIVVGEAAHNAELYHPDRVIVGVKRSMGSNFKKTVDGRDYTAEEISAEILKTLKEDATLHLNQVPQEVVITVPAYFGDPERDATKNAAEMAGLTVLEVITEPHAAALAYAIDHLDEIENYHLLVYDLGGGTFDVTLITTGSEDLGGVASLKIETVAKEGNRHLGGLDWDRVIARIVADKAMDDYGIDDPHLDAKSRATLLTNSEKAKRTLTLRTTCTVVADLQGHPVDISRAEFERGTSGLMQGAERLLQQVLDEAEKSYGLYSEKRIQELVAQGHSRDEFESKKIRLLLCGGSTRMPMVRESVERIMGEPPLHFGNPDLQVTVGAAYRAFLIGQGGAVGTDQPLEDEEEMPAPPVIVNRKGSGVTMLQPSIDIGQPVGVEVVFTDDDGNVTQRQNVVIIPEKAKNGEIFEKKFPTAFDNMTEIPLIFYEGSSPDITKCRRIADVSITGIPLDRPAGSLVKICLGYDQNGIVRGQAIDEQTGHEIKIEIKHQQT